jgi:hypothetical protein
MGQGHHPSKLGEGEGLPPASPSGHARAASGLKPCWAFLSVLTKNSARSREAQCEGAVGEVAKHAEVNQSAHQPRHHENR